MKNAKPPLSQCSISSDSVNRKEEHNVHMQAAKDELVNALTRTLQPNLINQLEKYKQANRSLRRRLSKAKFIYKRIARETEVFPSCFLSDDGSMLSEDDCNHKVKHDFAGAKLKPRK